MRVLQRSALAGVLAVAGAVVPAATSGPVTEVHAQSTVLRAVDAARGARIGASVTTDDNIELTTGVILETVEPGGPADKAGIKGGDRVTEFDGERVRSVRHFLRLVQETTPGRSVPVVLSRAGQRVTVHPLGCVGIAIARGGERHRCGRASCSEFFDSRRRLHQ